MCDSNKSTDGDPHRTVKPLDRPADVSVEELTEKLQPLVGDINVSIFDLARALLSAFTVRRR